MLTERRRWTIGALAAALLALTPVAAPAEPPTIVYGGPEPAPLAESVPPAPRSDLVWISGHWAHDGIVDEWIWQPGHWQSPRGVVVAPSPVAASPGPVVVSRPWWHRYWYSPWHYHPNVGGQWSWRRW